MSRFIRLFILSFLVVEASSLHAAFTSAKARRIEDLRKQCEDQGNGKACYDYARMLWSLPGAPSRGLARKKLLRGCELGYKTACQAYAAHAFKITPAHKPKRPNNCYHDSDLKRALFTDSAKGLKISKIRKQSFWARAGFEDGDVWLNMDETAIHNLSDALKTLKAAKKQMLFKVVRHGEQTTLVYACR